MAPPYRAVLLTNDQLSTVTFESMISVHVSSSTYR